MSKLLIIASLADSLVNFRGDLIADIKRRGHEVVTCAPEPEAAMREKLAQQGMNFHAVPMSRTGMNPIADLKLFLALRRLMQAEKPDAVFAYTIKPVVYGHLAARSLGIARRYALITGLGYAFTAAQKSRLRQAVSTVARWLYKVGLLGARAVIFQNPDDKKAFIDLGLIRDKGNIHIVNGSGVNTTHFTPAPLPEAPEFLLIARLLADKGVREYAEAARLVKAKHPEAEFHLVGPRDNNPSAISESELKEWTDGKTIIYHGATNDVRPFIAKASVYVLPSYREGTPRSVLEAMAMGRPIITTDVPGCRETVTHQLNGLLVPAQDAVALAGAMTRLIEEPQLRTQYAAESLMLVATKYDVTLVNRRMLEALEL